MSYLTYCKNCGRQVFADGTENERCYWCGQPIRNELNNGDNGNGHYPKRVHPNSWKRKYDKR